MKAKSARYDNDADDAKSVPSSEELRENLMRLNLENTLLLSQALNTRLKSEMGWRGAFYQVTTFILGMALMLGLVLLVAQYLK